MTIEIPLTKGYVALVDDEDAYLATYKWYAQIQTNGPVYAARHTSRKTGKRKTLLLHRVVLGIVGSSLHGDHINGDGLNNTRINLRVVTPAENIRNVHGVRSDNSSGYVGVLWDKRINKWFAQIMVAGHRKYLGSFESIEHANAARLAAEKEFWGITPRRAWAHGETM